MNNPTNLKYAKSHEWAEMTGETTARIGLTSFAQESLGGIVFVGLPEPGDTLTAGESLGDIESIKAASDILSPFTCTVTAVNEDLMDTPEKINDDPYGAWLVEVADITSASDLMDAAAYEAFCAEEE
jgi:glycine cleavage system H protein